MDDHSIIELFLTRDESALSELSDKYGARLQRLAETIVVDPGTAEECVNDAYLKAWKLIPPNEPRGHLFAFIARKVKCTAIDRARMIVYQGLSVI